MSGTWKHADIDTLDVGDRYVLEMAQIELLLARLAGAEITRDYGPVLEEYLLAFERCRGVRWALRHWPTYGFPLGEAATRFVDRIIAHALADIERVPWCVFEWLYTLADVEARVRLVTAYTSNACGQIGDQAGTRPDGILYLTVVKLTRRSLEPAMHVLRSSRVTFHGALVWSDGSSGAFAEFIETAVGLGRLGRLRFEPYGPMAESFAEFVSRLKDATFMRLMAALDSGTQATRAVHERMLCCQLVEVASALVQLDLAVYPLFWTVRWIWPDLPEQRAIRILEQTREVHRASLARRLNWTTD